MKRVISVLLAMMMIFALGACAAKPSKQKSEPGTQKTTQTDVSSSDPTSSQDESQEGSETVLPGGTTKKGETTTKGNGGTSANKTTAKGTTATTKKGVTTSPTEGTPPDPCMYFFGGESNKYRAKLRTMGGQSFYPMYSTKVNVVKNNFDLKSLKECMLTVTGAWKPAETVTNKEGEELSGPWAAIRTDGYLAGDTGFTYALKWVCEYSGTYNIMINVSGGTAPNDVPAAGRTETKADGTTFFVPAPDGVYMSAYIKGEKMFGHDTYTGKNHRLEETKYTWSKKLKRGDEIIIVADPKNNGGWDDPWWYMLMERTGN